jgi:hypothetical protein
MQSHNIDEAIAKENNIGYGLSDRFATGQLKFIGAAKRCR